MYAVISAATSVSLIVEFAAERFSEATLSERMFDSSVKFWNAPMSPRAALSWSIAASMTWIAWVEPEEMIRRAALGVLTLPRKLHGDVAKIVQSQDFLPWVAKASRGAAISDRPTRS